MPPVKAAAMSREQQSAGIVMAKVSEMSVSRSSEKSAIAGSTSMNPMTSKVTPTPCSEQVKGGSESEIATAKTIPESQNPEREWTHHSEREKESESEKKEAETPRTGKDSETPVKTRDSFGQEMEKSSEQREE